MVKVEFINFRIIVLILCTESKIVLEFKLFFKKRLEIFKKNQVKFKEVIHLLVINVSRICLFLSNKIV